MLKILLFPFSLLYDAVTRLRNHLYDRGLKPSIQFDLPVIGIGNLTVGGTGKTPMVEYLIRLLSTDFRVGILSRGYGRKTKGYRFAHGNETAQTIGDEPFQYAKKFRSKITVAVGEERALAIPLMLQENESLEVILLDDSFQHRRVRPSLNLLLTDYNRLFYKDLLLPAGRLRESAAGADRADLIVVTKCPPDIADDELIEIETHIRSTAEKPVFFASISYSNPIPFELTNSPCGNDVILVTGIASANPLVEYIRRNYTLIEHLGFGDHYNYSLNDVRQMVEKAQKANASIITTEKDMVKIDTPEFHEIIQNQQFFYIPIAVQFLKGESEFDEVILNHVRNGLDKK
jgi:tetraacyldisaccharide 4'-kinase